MEKKKGPKWPVWANIRWSDKTPVGMIISVYDWKEGGRLPVYTFKISQGSLAELEKVAKLPDAEKPEDYNQEIWYAVLTGLQAMRASKTGKPPRNFPT